MTARSALDPFTPDSHDHGRCVATALEQAADVCAARGVRLTDLRRQVLELVWQSHAPVGAYQILEQLAGTRGRVAPPTVYRALEFLAREGLVHRIDRLNAYVGCSSPARPHQAYFLICSACGDAAEFHDPELAATLSRCVERARFRLETATVELAGLCARCSGKAAPADRRVSRDA
ncbi:Fur family transcriptional regulator [Benzoatithermus flavus]|uniref:Fur family transcriptional regulator n=1 Tax=Benzoatithermus flavus TaxID=3108223 RepID=A0ABU8XKY1_9PROT